MLGVIKALTDVGNYIKELKIYYGLKNQVLYSSTAEWSSGSKTVANITKYQTIKVYPWDGYDGITLERVDSRFKGTGFATGVSSGSHTSLAFVLNVTQQDEVTIEVASLLHHTKSTSHSAVYGGWIKKIVGIEPIIPQTLTKLGGGINIVRGWLYAISKTMFDGYCKFYQNIQQQFTNWKNISAMGNIVKIHSCKRRRQQYNSFSNHLQFSSSGICTVNQHNQLCRFVYVWSERNHNNAIRYDISQYIYRYCNHTRKLVSNRCKIASDWGCYYA